VAIRCRDAREAVKALIVAEPFSRNRPGKTEGGGLDGLRARGFSARHSCHGIVKDCSKK
jgi:hypothetical protein